METMAILGLSTSQTWIYWLQRREMTAHAGIVEPAAERRQLRPEDSSDCLRGRGGGADLDADSAQRPMACAICEAGSCL